MLEQETDLPFLQEKYCKIFCVQLWSKIIEDPNCLVKRFGLCHNFETSTKNFLSS